MATQKLTALVFSLVFFSVLLQYQANAQKLSVNFYSKTCPSLSTIVNQTTASFISRDPTLAPALLRLHFHDCFVRGCDGSVLINSTKNNIAEKDAMPNLSLVGFQVIDAVKAAVESQCRSTVSCADVLALVARDAVVQINGPSWRVPLGRRDGRVSSSTEAVSNLPPASFNITQLITLFASKGLSVKDLVVLSGAHTIGSSHCSSIDSRIYNFTGRSDADPSMDKYYVAALKKRCSPGDTVSTIQMDPGSDQTFDMGYYTNVAKRRGLFHSDAALLNNPVTSTYVRQHTTTSGKSSFFNDFENSMVKLGGIGVLTGSAGEIRRICSAIN